MTINPIDRMATRSLNDVIGWIDSRIARLAAEKVVATGAVDRILAEDAVAAVEFPPFDRAGIDGVALRAVETVGASAYNPLGFHVTDGSGALAAGTAAQLCAGDRLPAGADAIVPPELAQPGATGTLDIIDAVPPEYEVERRASHFARGTVLVAAGRCVRAADLGLLAIGGAEQVAVVQRPRVAIMLTARDAAAAINATTLRPLLERDGGHIVKASGIEWTRTAIQQAISDSAADVVLLAGGPDRGRDREVGAAVAGAGTLDIAEVALSPGGSIAIGRTAAGSWVFALPGTPSSCLWAYEALIGRAIRRLAGRNPALPFRRYGLKLARKIVSIIGVTEIWPVRGKDDGSVEPLSGYVRSSLRAVTEADGFVIVAEGSEGMPAGSVVPVHLFNDDVIPATEDRSRDNAT